MKRLTTAPMTTNLSRTELLKWVVVALLAAVLVGGAAMAYWLPVSSYIVTCKKLETTSCELQREATSEHRTWQVELATKAIATVRIQPVRRGSPRVLLYLVSNSEEFFAAERLQRLAGEKRNG